MSNMTGGMLSLLIYFHGDPCVINEIYDGIYFNRLQYFLVKVLFYLSEQGFA